MVDEPLVLGIETSCDETGVGLVRGRELIGHQLASSSAQHASFGGVIPEIASRAHLEAMIPVLEDTCAQAGVQPRDIDAIAVTAGPGLVGALMVGLASAKGLATGLDRPLYGVNHLAAHVAVDQLEHGELPTPAIALLVSGGHTSLLLVDDLVREIKPLGATLDDAAGEAFDKVGRLLGMPFPGGPAIDRAAIDGDPNKIEFPRGLVHDHSHRYDFSFSGLKTAVARWVEQHQLVQDNLPISDIAASFQEAVVDVLVTKSLRACHDHGVGTLLVGGGVAANSRLRSLVLERGQAAGIEVRIPRPSLCTDNGAMVASLGSLAVAAGVGPSGYGVGADSTWSVTQVVA